MQLDKSCQIVEQYLAYLITIKGRSKNTVLEYRLDLLQFFRYVAAVRGEGYPDFQFVGIGFIRSVSLGDMYGSLAYCQDTLQSSPGTRTRKIVSIRQFWKYLKTKVHLIDNNITNMMAF
jgi:integrase/recombinase XerD